MDIQKFYEAVDSFINERLKSSRFKPTCKKYCRACCHLQMSITQLEAEHLVKYIKKENILIDHELLKKQALLNLSDQDWWQLPKEKKKCVFLSDEGLCKVYKARPLECRIHLVVSPKENCDDPSGNSVITQMDFNYFIKEFFKYHPTDKLDGGFLPKLLYLNICGS